MDKRFTLFMVLAVVILAGNQLIYSLLFAPPAPPKPAKVAKADAKKDPAAQVDAKQAAAGKAAPAKADAPAAEPPPAAAEAPAPVAANAAADKPPENKPAEAAQDEPAVAPQLIAMGSANPDGPFRMLVYATNRGAAIERLEMNSPRYRDLEDRSGYLGYLAPIDAQTPAGAEVRIVGPGTPAAAAGLQSGDIITAIGDKKIATALQLIDALSQTEPNQNISITIRRAEADQKLTATLGRRPLEVMRPEHDSKPVSLVRPGNHDPLSFLLSVEQFDDQKPAAEAQELKGVAMRDSEWEVVAAGETIASFRKKLPKWASKSPRPTGWKRCRWISSTIPTIPPTAWCWT